MKNRLACFPYKTVLTKRFFLLLCGSVLLVRSGMTAGTRLLVRSGTRLLVRSGTTTGAFYCRYVELKSRDKLKFGFSSRDYVMINEQAESKAAAADGSDDENQGGMF